MPVITCASQNCTADIKNGYGACVDPTIEYAGTVLATYERNGYNDSDFYAIVWTGDDFKHIEYASTRGWTYHNGAKVDATPEVIAAAEVRLVEILTDRWIDQARQEAEAPAIDRTVRVTRGKLTGTTGVVRWIGENRSRWAVTPRVGIKVGDNRKYAFVDGYDVEVVNPAPVDDVRIAEIKRNAAYRAAQHGWRTEL